MAESRSWLRQILTSPALDALAQTLRAAPAVRIRPSHGSSTHLLAGALAIRLNQPVLLVTAHLDEADEAFDDLELFDAIAPTFERRRFPALEVLPGETSVNLELLAERLAVVEWLVQPPAASSQGSSRSSSSTPNPWVLVAPVTALMQPVPRPERLAHYALSLHVGQKLSPGTLLHWLDTAGYQRTDAIEQPGDFSARGGIIDIFLPSSGKAELAESSPRGKSTSQQSVSGDSASEPVIDASTGPIAVRLDFFGDEIDSISLIDTQTMGSGPRLKSVQLVGASARQILNDQQTTHLLDLLPGRTLILLHEPLELSEQARGYFERLTQPLGVMPPDLLMKALTQRRHIQISQYGPTADTELAGAELPVQALPSFPQDAGQAVRELAELAGQGRVVVLAQKEAELSRLKELLLQHTAAVPPIELELGYLYRGFVWQTGDSTASPDSPASALSPSASRLFLIPHHELFHRYLTRRRIRRIGTSAESGTEAFFDLSPGDYVVHTEHGIARFVGLRLMRKAGSTQEYLTLEFARGALLHVPATRIDLVQKYVGTSQERPPLSVLGSKRWARQKEEAALAARDLARRLLQIQAARAALPGIRYPPDTPWQKEFEAEFPFEETPDQIAAMAQIKRDMSDEQPMDRLLCGDVGFGKTELAIRAAFKAAEFGKQVAVLVPTTVLAEQHERTFRQRLADYPFVIASLSRFKSPSEQARILADLAEGKIDIIIGTHRLLSDDVRFADLGLVIIDEEQRFGVEHKNRLLQFRLTADVLTLSATPIPRTLHMALLGLRDISSLATPPADRRAIVTEVIPYDETRIQQAIRRELARDGQVFFVHNRVHDIYSVAERLQQLVPEARIVVGHGQMPDTELEEVMLRFLRRQADILVCTTIIESGIDIPTANTIFIDQADQFGLAELHQLRGRVGRWKHRAYCYLLLPQDRPITDMAARRLKAIEQYSMLGAGFKIAMRDLEIRGAGNILGKEQSGHIAAVGYEMYCRLLEQEARRLRNEPVIEPIHTVLELGISSHIPSNYIPNPKYRMAAYRRLAGAQNFEQLDAAAADLTDAYGPPPPPVQQLLDLTELRIACGMLGVHTVKLEGPDLIFRTNQPARLDQLLKNARGRVSLIDAQTIYYRPPPGYLHPPVTLLAFLRKLLVQPLRQQPQTASVQLTETPEKL